MKRLVGGTQEYVLPDVEELARVTPLIEERLETIIEQESEEKEQISAVRANLLKQWKS